jgi:L-lactate dehydrogenase complex protein LldE
MTGKPEQTALFVTCLVDQFFPQVGEASVRLLEQAGCTIAFPEEQTCCGQPAFNMGYRDEARRLARRFVSIFEPYQEIVTPSGSCTSMVRLYYPELFEAEPDWQERAKRVGQRLYELTEFLCLKGFEPRNRFEGKVTYHDACHLLRELGIREQPRDLLRKLAGIELVEMEPSDSCCGFGGAFSVKMTGLSEAMLEDKLTIAEATGANVLTSTDCGCLMHLGGALSRRGSSMRALHIAEVLAGEAES